MPHLAPIKWLLFAIMFWLLLITSLTILWWQHTPKMVMPVTKLTPTNSPIWPWF